MPSAEIIHETMYIADESHLAWLLVSVNTSEASRMLMKLQKLLLKQECVCAQGFHQALGESLCYLAQGKSELEFILFRFGKPRLR